MIREDKTQTKKMLSTKNNIYIGLCILYILLSMINRKYPIGDIVLNVAYLSTWGSIFLWEIINILRKNMRDEIYTKAYLKNMRAQIDIENELQDLNNCWGKIIVMSKTLNLSVEEQVALFAKTLHQTY